ncbi:MAG: hypothetical protein FD127_4221, partial [Acidimicrobiaceae bacterium]
RWAEVIGADDGVEHRPQVPALGAAGVREGHVGAPGVSATL